MENFKETYNLTHFRLPKKKFYKYFIIVYVIADRAFSILSKINQIKFVFL